MTGIQHAYVNKQTVSVVDVRIKDVSKNTTICIKSQNASEGVSCSEVSTNEHNI